MPITAGQIAFGIDADHIETKTLALAQAYLFASGAIDGGALSSFEIPNSAAPTVNADGEIAVDTTVTDFSHGIFKYFGGEEMAVIAVPIAEISGLSNGDILSYNSTADEFQFGAPAAGGITNSAGNGVIPKSDGTNIVASSFGNPSAGFFSTNGTDGLSVQAGYTALLANGGYVFKWDGGGSLGSNGLYPDNTAWETSLGIAAKPWKQLYVSNFISLVETTEPSAPPANGAYIYAEDNGAGKTRVMALYSSGAAQQISIQP